jgi:hypothetical protein
MSEGAAKSVVIHPDFRSACGVTLILVAALLSCKKPGEGKLGETIAESDYRLTVLKTQVCTAGNEFVLGNGNMALGVELIIEHTGSKQLPFNPTYVQIIDSAGRRYKGTPMAYCKPSLPAHLDNVDPHKPLRGFVTFEMPATATGLKLSFSPYMWNQQEIKFDLGR